MVRKNNYCIGELLTDRSKVIMEKKEQSGNWGFYKPPIGKKRYWVNLDEFKPCLWHRIVAKLKGLHLVINKRN